MKLKYVKDYKSIKKFADIELPDFVVLTGINGSGKTHLMEAIGSNVVLEIDGNENKDSAYLDYNDFIVKETPVKSNQLHKTIKKNQDDNIINAGIKRLADKINVKVKKFKDNYQVEDSKSLNKSQLFAKNLAHKMFQHKVDFLNITPLADIEWTEEPTQDEKKEIYKKFTNTITDLKSLRNFKKYYEISQQKQVHIIGLQANHVKYNEDFLGQLLENEFKAYREKQTQNDNNFKPAERGENVEYLSEEDFIKKHGPAPWHFFNEILEKYGCNNYLVNWEGLPSPQYPQTPQQFILHITVKNSEGIPVPIADLSSGEKTLLALAYQIYRNQKDGNLPEVLLLDEIDTCLHPSMTRQLLEVLKKVFIDKYGMKIILVTHAPSTVALAPEESIYTMKKDGEDRVEKKTKEEALEILTDGFVSLSQSESDFSISYSLSKASGNIVLTEGITDKIILETAWVKLFPDTDMPFYIQDCFDAPFIRSFLNRANDQQDGIFVKYPDKKFIALFDFDTAGYNAWNQINDFTENSETDPKKGLAKKHASHATNIMLLPVPEISEIQNQVIQNGINTYKDKSHLTIELLFYGIDSLSRNFANNSTAGGGTIIKFIGDKRQFAENCTNCNEADFENFKPLFEKLNGLFNGN